MRSIKRGRQRPALALLLLLAAAVALPGPAWALTDEEIFRNFRFNLLNPGARSLAMGGAFLSLADDATAAQSNPAGLGFLARWEAFAELRSIDNGIQASTRTGSTSGTDLLVASGADIQDVIRPSFLSGVVTFDRGLRWRLGLSRQELLNIESTTLSSFLFTFADTPGTFVAQGDGIIDMQVVNWNVSAGFRITDSFGVGVTLTASELDLQSDVTNVVLDTGGAFGQRILEPTLDIRTTVDDTDRDVVFGVGLIYQRERWGVGTAYRKGPDFALQQRILLTEPGATTPTGVDVFRVRETLGPEVENRFGLPDVLAVGGHWRPLSRLTLALNLERILYSNLIDGFVAGVNVLTDFDADFEIDDGTDARFGAEYVLVPQKLPPLALRAGVYTESDSTIRARSTGTQNLADPSVFSGGENQTHGTVGLGIVFPRAKIDFAADFAETDNEFVVSFIYQGKRR